MNAIDRMFQRLRQQGRKAFMPFITAGDPTLDFSGRVLRQLSQCGVSLCELGVPYSDPIADGPVIQASYTRALDRGVKVPEILAMLRQVTPQMRCPLVTMVSYAIIYRYGLQRFVTEAAAAGVSGTIVPDLLVEECDELAEICAAHDFSLIQLVTPTTPRPRALQVAQRSTGFLYYVSVTGITGERTALPAKITENVQWLREHTDLPICIGFGISQPQHVRALAEVADGVIVGSALVRRIAECGRRGEAQVLEELSQFTASLMSALNPAAGS